MPPRKYEQRLRAETADETRRRILDALYKRLEDGPSEPVSIEQIARLARVSRSTVYLIFGSRAGLFDALAAELFESGEFELVVQATMNADARESLRGATLGGTGMFAAHRDVFRVLYSMAQLDPGAVGGAVQRLEELRAGGMSRLAQKIADQGLLRDDVSKNQAEQLLWLWSSFDAFDLLYTGKGMSVEEITEMMIEMAERTLYR